MSETRTVDLLLGATHDGAGVTLIAVALMAGALLHTMRDERRTLYNTIGLFLFSLAAQYAAVLVSILGYESSGGILRGLFILTEGLAVIRLAGMVIARVLLPLLRFTPASILEDLLVIGGYLLWGMVRLHEHGVELSSLVTTSAVITAVIAFSMQDTLGNILGGIALQLDNSINKDEWIEVDGVVGRIVDIRWRFTAIETRNWETVVIPNSVLMKNKFLVLGRREGQPVQLRRWIWFNIDYSVSPAQVISVAERAVQGAVIPGVATNPTPNCVMMDYGDSAGRYAMRYWLTDLFSDDPTDSMVRAHMFAALQRAGLKPAWPRQNLHLIKESEKLAEQRHQEHVAERVDLLKQLALFTQFSDEELRLLAERLVYAPFARGDVITRQGAAANWLYILARGQVEAVLDSLGSARRVVGKIEAGGTGSFFGEMGLLTGDPRSATVVAVTDVLCYRLNKAAFTDIIQARPAIAEEVSRIMAERRVALDNARQEQDAAKQKAEQRRQQGEIVSRIRAFFRL
ncbi:MAG: mechanosensitive ion channel family protein [Chromatiales bacterium]|nr:mechanosensitive ion channel family protein [Chromatiales bacterium]